MFTSLAAVCCSLCHLANSFRINQRPPPADTLVLSAHIPFCRALQGVVGTRTPFGLRSRANLRFRNACGRGVLCAQWVSKCAVQCTDELTFTERGWAPRCRLMSSYPHSEEVQGHPLLSKASRTTLVRRKFCGLFYRLSSPIYFCAAALGFVVLAWFDVCGFWLQSPRVVCSAVWITSS